MGYSRADEAIVERQLGRSPRGEWRVAARCHLGVASVIESHPILEDGSPFPTSFWLTCPVLVKRAARLESEGWMATVNERLADDRSLIRRLSLAVDRYRRRRDRRSVIDDRGSPPGGGPQRIKCVHAHVAHQLSDPPNAIGALALAETGWPDCREPCVSAVENER